MARHSRSRKGTRKGLRLFSRVYSPLHHLLKATENVSNSVFRRTGRIAKEGIAAVDNVGSSVMKHANMAVSNVIGRKSRKNRRNVSRKNRKNTMRKNRK